VTRRADARRRGLVVAIDGPSGVGKTTIARAVANRMGCRYIDTGAMYRAVALLAREKGVSSDDAQGLARLGKDMEVEFVETEEGPVVRLNGEECIDFETNNMLFGVVDYLVARELLAARF